MTYRILRNLKQVKWPIEGVQIHYFLLNFLCEEIQVRNVTSQVTDFGYNNFALFCPKYQILGTRSMKTKTPIDMRFCALNQGFYGEQLS